MYPRCRLGAAAPRWDFPARRGSPASASPGGMATDALRAFYHYYITILLLYLPYYLTLLWHCSCQDR